MYQTTYLALKQLKQLCPLHSSIANCLNQLRQAKIQFLNLKYYYLPTTTLHFDFQTS